MLLSYLICLTTLDFKCRRSRAYSKFATENFISAPMGCVCSSDDVRNDDHVKSDLIMDNPATSQALMHKESVALGKGFTNAHLAVAMLQANRAAAIISTGSSYNNELDYDVAQKYFFQTTYVFRIIRKAKHEGCTVSYVDSYLYIDYKFVGILPPEMI